MKKLSEKNLKRVKRIMMITTILSFVINTISPVYAADDPISVINNLSNFIFTLTRAIGTIILIFGIVQIGMSYQSHDPSQRTNGVFTLVGGVIITFAKEIIGLITG
jgi:hypothetical protein